MTHAPHHHRPSVRSPAAMEVAAGSHDPLARVHAAHETAAVLVHTGRSATDPAVAERLVRIVDEIGLSTLADLWAERPARTLPGALWRLYVLRDWMCTQPEHVAREYGNGIGHTEPDHAVAGIDPPGPTEVTDVADRILRGVYTGDFGVALERAAAFCRVVSAGRAVWTVGEKAAEDAARMADLAIDLAACAKLWRSGRLE